MTKLLRVVFVALLVSLCVGLNAAEDVLAEEEMQEMFAEWMETYDKHYQGEEFITAFANFKDNLIYVGQYNEKLQADANTSPQQKRDLVSGQVVSLNPATRLGLNGFSDMTYQQFASIYTGAIDPSTVASALVSGSALSAGAIAGIAVGGAAALTIVGAAVLVAKKRGTNSDSKPSDSKDPDVTPGSSSPRTPDGASSDAAAPSKPEIPQGGLAVYTPKTTHLSITARTPPILGEQ